MTKEIEVKAKTADLGKIKTKLEKLGCVFTDPIIQDDTTFVNFEGDYTRFPKGTNFLRIRKAKGKILFTLKQPQKNDLDCIEKEVEISEEGQFRGALELMGYHEVVRIYKTRIKTRYNNMEICLDEVKDLGTFVEVEKITERDAEEVQKELFGFLESLGVKGSDRVTKGYDTLVYLSKR